MLDGRPAVVGGAVVLIDVLYMGDFLAELIVVVLGMRLGGWVACSMLAGAVSALTSWRIVLRNSPPSVTYTPLHVLISPHIL